MYIKPEEAGRRIFIPSVVLSVDVVVVLVKHTERQSCLKILMFPHQNQDRTWPCSPTALGLCNPGYWWLWFQLYPVSVWLWC